MHRERGGANDEELQKSLRQARGQRQDATRRKFSEGQGKLRRWIFGAATFTDEA
jgi:hypothetical protein